MDKSEIALRLTLTMLERGLFTVKDSDYTNESYGALTAKLYNAILENLSSK
jgi:hypothetical protein